MKVLLKKFTVIAAAFAMLFAVSSCSDPNGKANPDKKTGDNTTTAAAADAASDAGSTSGGEQSGGGQSGGQSSQTVTTVASFEEFRTESSTVIFYSDNTWKVLDGDEVYESGTYTGDPTQDGNITAIITKKFSNESHELENYGPENLNLVINDDIFYITVSNESSGNYNIYFIRKANKVAEYTCFAEYNSNCFLRCIKFYDNNTFHEGNNGYFNCIGTYEGDPCAAEGQIVYHEKYRMMGETFGEDPYTQTLTIANNRFTKGIDVYGCEIAKFKATITQSSSEVMDFFAKFYANDGILLTYIFDGCEKFRHYGTYVGNPVSSAQDAQNITATFIKAYNENNNKWVDIPQGQIPENPVTITISNDQFTWIGETFTRQ